MPFHIKLEDEGFEIVDGLRVDGLRRNGKRQTVSSLFKALPNLYQCLYSRKTRKCTLLADL